MFDYFKNAASKLKKQESAPERKPKKDRVFIIILIAFAAFAVFSAVSGFSQGTEQAVQTAQNGFRFGISDGIILAAATGGYIYFAITKKGK